MSMCRHMFAFTERLRFVGSSVVLHVCHTCSDVSKWGAVYLKGAGGGHGGDWKHYTMVALIHKHIQTV